MYKVGNFPGASFLILSLRGERRFYMLLKKQPSSVMSWFIAGLLYGSTQYDHHKPHLLFVSLTSRAGSKRRRLDRTSWKEYFVCVCVQYYSSELYRVRLYR